MPSLTISEEEFSTLSEPTQEELLNLFKKSFVLRSESSTAKAPDTFAARKAVWDAEDEKKENWFARLSDARSAKETVSYQDYYDRLLKLQSELPLVLKAGHAYPTAISLETAIGFVIGLNPDSIKVLSKLVTGRATRKDLEEILKSAGKINGTVGSINRRFSKRLDKRIYGEKLDQIKLIEFDETYRLTCDPASISLAIRIIEKGYKIGKGDISLQFNHWDVCSEAPAQELSYDLIVIGEEAIKLANQGLGFMRSVHWEIDYNTEKTAFEYFHVVVTASSSTLVIETVQGDSEWVNDDGKSPWKNSYHHNSFPDEIIFGTNVRSTFKKK